MRLVIPVLTIACAVATASIAFAQPDNKGHGRGNPQGGGPSNAASHPGGGGPQASISISDRDRNEVYSYYRGQYAAGNCPPGQAKKAWTMNQPLPAGVLYEVLPRDLLGRLSPAPSGYQYVRVANDVLMMAVGTRMIVGALADLGAL